MTGKRSLVREERSSQAPGQEPIRVLVIAPTLALRTGLRALFSTDPGIKVIGEAAVLLGFDALPSSADVLVIAAGSGSASNLESVLTESATAGVLLLVDDPLPVDWARPQLYGRAWGLLPLDSSVEDLTAAVRAISAGLFVGTPALVEPLLESRQRSEGEHAEPLAEPLTDREIEVLQLLAQGLANKQIAAVLGISEHTVKFHVSGIYTRLGAASRTEAVRLGVRQGLIIL